ncbi:hypothetical protein GF402_07045 [Candidatus Fermentibacteria bacterium]|nr:hypothetical protein [Candidatus Fermentibacteria bacterium]
MVFLLACTLLSVTPEWSLQTSCTHVTSLRESGGSIWAATSGGAFKFDPDSEEFLEFLSYPDQLPTLEVEDVLESTNGTLWVATRGGGLAARSDGVWTTYSSFEGLPGTGIVYCVAEEEGCIWAGTDEGVGRQDGEWFVPLDESSTGGGFTSTDVYDLARYGDDLWFATDEGVFVLDLTGNPFSPGSWTHHGETSTLSPYSITVDSDTLAAIACYDGVYIYVGTGWTRILSDSEVNDVLFSQWGLLAASDGVQIFDGFNWASFGTDYPSCFVGPYYADAFLETENRLWCGLGTFRHQREDWGRGLGVVEGPDSTWNSVDIPGQPSKSVYQMNQDGANLYLGTHYLGALGGFPEGWSTWVIEDGLPTYLRTYSVAPDGNGDLWAAAYHRGLTWVGGGGTFDPADDTLITFVSDSLAQPPPPPTVTEILCPLLNNQVMMLARQGDVLWIPQELYWSSPGTDPSGLVALEGVPPDTSQLVWTTFEPAFSGLATKNLATVYPVGNDGLWIAFKDDGGCQYFHHGGTPPDQSDDYWEPMGRAYTTDDGLSSNYVNCFARTSDGTIYVGTNSGLCSFNGSGNFVQVEGITGSVEAMTVDGESRVWSAGSNGVTVIDGSEVTVFDDSNSPYIVSARSENEFAATSTGGDSVFFSSQVGLWVIVASKESVQEDGISFYPQPYLPSEGLLHLCGIPAEEAVEVDIFTLDGRHVKTIGASEASEWTWNGSTDGGTASSGLYVARVVYGSNTKLAKIALVR